MTILTDIITFIVGYAPPHPDLTPAAVRIGHAGYAQIMSDLAADPFHQPGGSIVGLRLRIDPNLPDGVWRVSAADDTLIYDNRQPHPVEIP